MPSAAADFMDGAKILPERARRVTMLVSDWV